MMNRGYLNPTAYAKSKGVGTPDNRTAGDDYTWQPMNGSSVFIRIYDIINISYI